MNQSASHFFRGRFVPSLFHSNRTPFSVVLDNTRVVDRQLCCLVLKASQWIATGSHHVPHDLVSLLQRKIGIVHKPGLNRCPFVAVARSLFRLQTANVYFFHPVLEPLQLGLRAIAVARLPYRAIVLGAKTLPKTRASPL